jgi:hypothetical protein
MLVFQLIQQSGNMGTSACARSLHSRVLACSSHLTRRGVAGIWTKDLKIRSNLQQPQARHVRHQAVCHGSVLTRSPCPALRNRLTNA